MSLRDRDLFVPSRASCGAVSAIRTQDDGLTNIALLAILLYMPAVYVALDPYRTHLQTLVPLFLITAAILGRFVNLAEGLKRMAITTDDVFQL